MWWHNTSTMRKNGILLHLTFSEPFFQSSSVKYLMTVCRLTHTCSQTLINFLLIQNYLWNKGFSGFPGKFFKARFILNWSIAVNVTKILRACHGTFSKPPNDLRKTAFYHIRNISRTRPCLSIDSTKTLVHVLVLSRWDHCNSLLYGLPDYLIQRLRYVMNAAAKVITCKQKLDHVTPLLIELHWLPVRQRIIFKILLYTFKALHGAAPTYLTELIRTYVPKRALRSADQLQLEEPTHKLKLTGLRTFSVCAPYPWNSVPFEIKRSAPVSIFKAKLKTYFFRQTYF